MQSQIALNSGNTAVLQRLLLQHCIQKGFTINSHSPGTCRLNTTQEALYKPIIEAMTKAPTLKYLPLNVCSDGSHKYFQNQIFQNTEQCCASDY